MKNYTFTSSLPSPHLQFLIKNFFSLEYDKGIDHSNYLLPDGLPSVFYLETNVPFTIKINDHTVHLQKGFYASYSNTIVNLQHGQFKISGVSVYPIYFHLIFRQKLSDLLNHFIKLDVPESLLFSHPPDHSTFIRLFEHYLTIRVNEVGLDDDSKELYQTLIQSAQSAGHTLRIDKLAKQLGYSTRTLHTYFHQRFGMSPKRFMKLLRFSLALKYLYDGDKPKNLSLLAHEAGYHDQSHLTRDFKSICGKTPGELSTNVMTLASKFRQF